MTWSRVRSLLDGNPARRLAPFLLVGAGFLIAAAALLIWERVSGDGPGRWLVWHLA